MKTEQQLITDAYIAEMSHVIKVIHGTMEKPGGYSVNGKEFTGDEHEALVDEAKQMAVDQGKRVEHVLQKIIPKHHFN